MLLSTAPMAGDGSGTAVRPALPTAGSGAAGDGPTLGVAGGRVGLRARLADARSGGGGGGLFDVGAWTGAWERTLAAMWDTCAGRAGPLHECGRAGSGPRHIAVTE